MLHTVYVHITKERVLCTVDPYKIVFMYTISHIFYVLHCLKEIVLCTFYKYTVFHVLLHTSYVNTPVGESIMYIL